MEERAWVKSPMTIKACKYACTLIHIPMTLLFITTVALTTAAVWVFFTGSREVWDDGWDTLVKHQGPFTLFFGAFAWIVIISLVTGFVA